MQKPTQLAATEATLNGSTLRRLAIGARALYTVLRDPNETEQVLILGLALSRSKFPELLTRFLLSDEGASLLRDQLSINSKAIDFGWLRSLPKGTLGREYIDFVDREKIDPDFFEPPPGLPEVPTYISQRMRQTHDLWHVLTGYSTDVPGELSLQAFTYAQTDMPPALLVSLFGTLKFAWRDPKLLKMTLDGYRRGRRATFLPNVRWEDRWELPIDDVRREFGILPAEIEPVIWGRDPSKPSHGMSS